jgi:hypothetical protein
MSSIFSSGEKKLVVAWEERCGTRSQRIVGSDLEIEAKSQPCMDGTRGKDQGRVVVECHSVLIT